MLGVLRCWAETQGLAHVCESGIQLRNHITNVLCFFSLKMTTLLGWTSVTIVYLGLSEIHGLQF